MPAPPSSLALSRTTAVTNEDGSTTDYSNADLNNGSANIKDYTSALSDLRAIWQRVWESEVGSVHQNDFETVTTHYTVDYLSMANRDIMVTEDGSWTARYVYDESSVRISAEFSYADGTARGTTNADGEYGENPASDIAVSDISKVWYRTSLLGSTLYAVDATGQVLAHAVYDPWGQPLTETYTDTNFSGLTNLNNFTGYTWDDVLGLYFAQNRFYDADSHRFTQEDAVKDGANWYVYCYNTPTIFADLYGFGVYIGGTYVETKTFAGSETQYASIRDLIAVYGGNLPSNSITSGNSVYYHTKAGLVDIYFYTKTNGKSDKRLSFLAQYNNWSSANIYSADIKNSDGTNYVSAEYFCKIMCQMGYSKEFSTVTTFKMSSQGKAMLKALELMPSYAPNVYQYDSSGKILGSYPYTINDGMITMGYGHAISYAEVFGTSAQKDQYEIGLYNQYAPNGKFPNDGTGIKYPTVVSGSNPLSLKTMDDILNRDIMLAENAINNTWLIPNKVNVSQQQFDALVMIRHHQGSIGEKTRTLVETSANRQAWERLYGTDSRYTHTFDLYFNGVYYNP